MAVQFLGWEDPLETEMVTHSSILAGKSHGEEADGLQSKGPQRVRHDLVTEYARGAGLCVISPKVVGWQRPRFHLPSGHWTSLSPESQRESGLGVLSAGTHCYQQEPVGMVRRRGEGDCHPKTSFRSLWVWANIHNQVKDREKEGFIITCSKWGEYQGSFPKQHLCKMGSFKLRVHAYPWGSLSRGESSIELGQKSAESTFSWLQSWGSISSFYPPSGWGVT